MSYSTTDEGGPPDISSSTYSTPSSPSPSPYPSPSSSPSPRPSPSSSTAYGDSTTNPASSTASPQPSSTTPWIASSTEIMTSTPVQITSVSSSNGVVQTYTSTYYSSYRTPTAVPSPSSEHSTNVGAIVGGVIGGVAFVALIGIAAFILMKRRRKQRNVKDVYDTSGGGKEFNSHPSNNNDFNSYGSPTHISGNMSQSEPPLGESAALGTAAGANPRPLVQSYNPDYDDQQSKLYPGSQSPQSAQQQQYYEDYQGYQPSYINNSNYNNGAYAQRPDPAGLYPQQMQDNLMPEQQTGLYPQQQQSQNGYYTHQTEPSMTVLTSPTAVSSNIGRNVPDEIDYYPAVGTRHVPDEP